MTYRIEVTYPWHPGAMDGETRTAETVEEAAQIFESLAEVPATYTLSEIVENLSLNGELEYQCPESGKTVTVTRVGVEMAEARS